MNTEKEMDPRDNYDTDVGILELFGREKLEYIQATIAKVTGLGAITADFRGEPLTQMTSFTPFCQFIREKGNNGKLCNLSDAFGIVRSAITKKHCVYFCPCGLMEVAIPIVVQGKFLGGFLAGQVRCNNAPEDVPRFSGLIQPEYDEKDREQVEEHYSQIPVYEYEKSQLDKQLIYIQSKMSPHFLISTLTDIANFSILEDAPKANEMTVALAHHLMHSFYDTNENILLSKEFEQIALYFNMVKIKYEDNFEYTLAMKREMEMQRIPSHILFPFLERSVSLITVNSGRLKISVSAGYEKESVILLIKSDFDPDETGKNGGSSFKNFPDNEAFHDTVANIRKRLHGIFGDEYEIKEYFRENQKISTLIRFPAYYNEKTV